MPKFSDHASSELTMAVLLFWACLLIFPPSTTAGEFPKVISNNVPPYSSPLNGRPEGIFPDIMSEISRRMHEAPVTIEYCPWKTAYAITTRGSNHLLMPLARTPEREKDFQWISPICKVNMTFITYGATPAMTRDSARNAPLIVTKEKTPMAHFLKENGYTNYHLTPTSKAAARMLVAGTADIWFAPIVLSIHILRNNGYDPSKLVFGETAITSDLYISASHKTDHDLVLKMQTVIKEIHDDGTHQKILQKYTRRTIE